MNVCGTGHIPHMMKSAAIPIALIEQRAAITLSHETSGASLKRSIVLNKSTPSATNESPTSTTICYTAVVAALFA